MKKWFSLTLGIVTATGGFLDAGTVATSGEAGAKFGLGLIWAVVIATIAIILLVEMVGRFTAVSQKTYADAIRENLIENGPALLGLLTLSFIAGIIALGGPSQQVLTTLWRPDIKQGNMADYLYLVAAILGATISPYLLYFYSSGALEEKWSAGSLLLNRVTAIVGMGFGSVGSMALVFLGAIVLQPLNINSNTLAEIGLTMAKPFGVIGSLLFAAALFATCLGASLEVVLGVSYNIAQGFGWEWGEGKKPVEAARFNLVLTIFLIVAVVIGSIGIDPLQLALFASTIIALFLPISLSPFLILMNDRQYLGDKTNGRFTNIAIVCILVIAFIVALVSLPLEIFSGGG